MTSTPSPAAAHATRAAVGAALAAAFTLAGSGPVFAQEAAPAAPAPAAAPSPPITCEGLRSSIESKIASAGVKTFSVTLVDAAAPASGRVVGTCERGSRKIVYATPNASSAAPQQQSMADDGMLTECRDGSEPVRGRCKP